MVYINRPLFNGLKEITNNVVKKIYTESIQNINLNMLRCCQKQGGSFVIHGYYSRRLKIKDTTISMSILRIRCGYCNKTHALFFSDFIPYSMFNTYEGKKILMNDIDDDFSYEVIEKIKRIKRQILARLSLLGIRISDDVSIILERSIHSFCGHFLQIHRGRIASILLESG